MVIMDELVSEILQYLHIKEDEANEAVDEVDGQPFEALYDEGRADAYGHMRAFIAGTYLDYKSR